MESYSLSFETKEFIEGLEGDNNFIVSKDRKAWLRKYPEIVKEIDIQIRKFFNINDKRELVFSLYQFGEDSKNIQIHQQTQSVVNRVIISTSEDEMKTTRGKTYPMAKWEAYEIPQKFRDKVDIFFSNKIKIKNDFRGLRQRKKDKNRYVLVFEYIFNRSEVADLIDKLTGVDVEEDLEIDTTVDSFLN